MSKNLLKNIMTDVLKRHEKVLKKLAKNDVTCKDIYHDPVSLSSQVYVMCPSCKHNWKFKE